MHPVPPLRPIMGKSKTQDLPSLLLLFVIRSEKTVGFGYFVLRQKICHDRFLLFLISKILVRSRVEIWKCGRTYIHILLLQTCFFETSINKISMSWNFEELLFIAPTRVRTKVRIRCPLEQSPTLLPSPLDLGHYKRTSRARATVVTRRAVSLE